MSRPRVPDAVIVGCGAVGATLALALARARRRVVVLDTRPGPTAAPGDDYAEFVVSLNLASSCLLGRLGVWDAIRDFRVSPYIAMELWDAGGTGHTRFDSAAIGEPVLGHFVENALLESVLQQALAVEPNVDLYWNMRPQRLERATDRVRLVPDEGGAIEAALVVGADGGRSRLRELAGIAVERRDYGQRALVCNFATERDHGAVARQRFLPGGPVAMLPLADGRCSLAWFQPADVADELLRLAPQDFRQRLSEATDSRLGAVTATTPVRGVGIARQHACDYVRERVALVGDAAHVIHPLAGQGLNLGLLDAAALAAALEGRGDAGAWLRLRRYARWRRSHNTAMMAAMDLFHDGFARGGAVQAALRNLGMNLADHAGPVKQEFIRHGAGLAGDLPPLARRQPG